MNNFLLPDLTSLIQNSYLPDLIKTIFFAIRNFRLLDLLDIAITGYVIYNLFLLIRGTRAVQLLRGLLFLILIYYITSKFLQLQIITWIMEKAAFVGVIAIPIVFQPELRRVLAQLGQGKLILSEILPKGKEFFGLIEIIVSVCKQMSNKNIGALIIIERETGLKEFIETGTKIDAEVSSELLMSIFHPGNPLHDGAVIIKNDRIASAGSLLPLSESLKSTLSGKQHLGTRHRAAIGLSEHSDAICIVVSEETGDISVAIEGKIYRHLSEEKLQELLLNYCQDKTVSEKPTWLLQPFLKGFKLDLEKSDKKNEKKDKKVIENKTSILNRNLNLQIIAGVTAIVLGLLILGPNYFQYYDRNFILPVQIMDIGKIQKQGKKIEIEPKQVRIKVKGNKKNLENLQPEHIKIYVELKKSIQNQILPIGISLPTDIDIISKEIVPLQVRVKIVDR